MFNKLLSKKKYTPQNKIYSVFYPRNWVSQIDPDDNSHNTVMFYVKNNGISTLRITPFISPTNRTKDFIKDYSKKFKDSKIIEKNGCLVLHYIDYANQDNEELIMQWWNIAKNEKLILISLTIPKKDKDTEKLKSELNCVKEIIDGIIL